MDVDYCQFTDWTGPWGYQKPTRIWAGPHIVALKNRLCHPPTCPNTLEHNGRLVHREKLGGRHMRFNQRQKFRIPEGVIRYLCSFSDPEVVKEIVSNLWKMGFQPTKRVRFEDEENGGEELVQLARHIATSEHAEAFVRGVVVAEGPKAGPEAEALRQGFLADYKDSVFDIQVRGPPPIRGPFGEATIKLKPGAIPKKQRSYHILGDRKVRFENNIRRFEEENRLLEDGVGPWNSPAFTVPKPNDDRVVIDYRYDNDCTETDAHPLPRIEDILLNQGKFKIWSVLDLKDGYHQVPLKKEDRHITCMSTRDARNNGPCSPWV